MDLGQTAVGSAILKKYPQVAQVAPQQGSAGQVKTVTIPPGPMGQQSATVLFFAILTKWQGQNLQAQNIKLMVQRCLQSAVKQEISKVAFPPLGMGRKFQLPEDTVASAMVSTAHQFLQNNRGTLQGITFVIYDTSVARKFRETARNLVQPPPPPHLQALLGLQQPAHDSGSDDDNDSDNDDDSDNGGYGDGGDFVSRASDHDWAGSDEDAYGGQFAFAFDDEDQDQIDPMMFDDDTDFQPQPYSGYEARMVDDAQDFQPQPSNRFEARLCLQQPQHFQAVKTALCQELKSTFIFEDRVEDTKTFKKLRTSSFDDIKAIAARKDVVLDFQTRGSKEVLVARGQKVSVMEVMGNIKDKIHAQLAHQAQRSDTKDHRLSLGTLPSESDRKKLPSYWTICQKGLFKSFDQWLRKKINSGNLYPVTQGSSSEYTEIINLITNTWDQRFVGAGKDARNLSHRAIQVVKVERLENPNLWELYCMRRERLVRAVQSQGSVFVPVERLRGSTGVVKTTSNLASGSLLTRDVISKVKIIYWHL
ncbi:uncharacterized protein [Littorina saxatilis]|uniref:uncharacterized protein n=1 Tax=Littorina saxatilis TaxID=31220 RepID=UPI0038B67FA0